MIILKNTKNGKLVKDLSPGSDERILVKCTNKNCSKESWVKYNLFLRRKNKKYLCKPCSVKKAGFDKRGKYKGRPGHPQPKGKDNVLWKGGKLYDKNGYVSIRTDFKKKGWSSYKKEHIVIMEAFLKRPLKKGEQIHHIDGKRDNNALSNLVLVQSNFKHNEVHNSLTAISYTLIQKNLIVFNHNTNKYVAHQKLRELLEQPTGQSAAKLGQ